MYKIIFIFMLSIFVFSSNNYTHTISYKGIELGSIVDVNTYKEGYMKADISSFWLQVFFNRYKFVWYSEGMVFDEQIYETEEDTYGYMALMKTTHDNLKQENYEILFNNFKGKCYKEIKITKCTFEDTSTKEIGNIVFDNELNILKYSDANTVIEAIK